MYMRLATFIWRLTDNSFIINRWDAGPKIAPSTSEALEDAMNQSVKQSLFWTPRILSILFAAFLSLFALDVFGEGLGLWRTILALLIHLAPVGFLVLVLILAWRWEWIGGVLFPALGVLYIIWAWDRFRWPTFAIISGPLFLLGVLFTVNWLYRVELHNRG